MSMNNRSRRQSGLSMIELPVALAISSFLILGITQIYLDNKRNYRSSKARQATRKTDASP